MWKGSIGFEQFTQTVQLANGTTVEADVMTIGATGLDAFVGINGPHLIDGQPNPDAVGFALTDLEFALALVTPKAGQVEVEGLKWTTLTAQGRFSFDRRVGFA